MHTNSTLCTLLESSSTSLDWFTYEDTGKGRENDDCWTEFKFQYTVLVCTELLCSYITFSKIGFWTASFLNMNQVISYCKNAFMTWESKSKSVVLECDQIVFLFLFLKFLLKKVTN